ncbi:MAG: hypothetical protein MJ240_01815 [Kiritimatiellae bacterium]|nr:hypothetical protein [Kiritimatiellia bacterium]
MTLEEARKLVNGDLWPSVRDNFLATGEIVVYPSGDLRRLEYLTEAERRMIRDWQTVLEHAAEWRLVVDGGRVRELKAQYPGAYPEALRYAAYFPGGKVDVMKLLKLKFPEAYRLCCS